jgi:hypothetical protein
VNVSEKEKRHTWQKALCLRQAIVADHDGAFRPLSLDDSGQLGSLLCGKCFFGARISA